MMATMKELSFLPEFVAPILQGEKEQTARPNKYGIEKGDDVLAVSKSEHKPFAKLRIVDVQRRTLGSFDEEDAHREGLPSLDEFIRVWNKIHPWKGFDPDQKVYVFRWDAVGVAYD